MFADFKRVEDPFKRDGSMPTQDIVMALERELISLILHIQPVVGAQIQASLAFLKFIQGIEDLLLKARHENILGDGMRPPVNVLIGKRNRYVVQFPICMIP